MKYIISLPILLAASYCPPTPTPTPAPPCPAGQCLIGYTNSVPPNPICGICPTPTPTCANIDCAIGSHCVEGRTGPVCIPNVVPSKCPAVAPEGSKYINRKIYGQGLDSTPRVRDKAYCLAVAQVDNIDCKANPEGSGLDDCDKDFLGQNCPQWQYQNPTDKTWSRCLPMDHPIASCDHFEHWSDASGTPYTGNCEKNANGSPITGFFMIPHGATYFRACNASGTVCSEPIFADN